MIAEQTVAAMMSKEMIEDKKRFKVTLPDNSTVWLTGSSISGAFIDGWNKYGQHLLTGEPITKPKETKTFKEYGDMWLEIYKKPKVSQKWYKDMKTILNNHIYPKIGDMLLPEIRTEHIAAVYQKSSELSLSINDKIKIIVNGILNSAVEDDLIDKNVARTNRLTVSGVENERTPLTEEEISKNEKHSRC